jgi:26S proteasome non-ATPase regulatory subunit 9
MAAQSERVAIKALADQRAVLEAEMEAVLSRLNAPGMPGVTGRLVDAEVRCRRGGRVALLPPCFCSL